ncbi:MAG: HEPN domain-containing protein [Thermoguttaceae bacterium]
MKNIIAEWLKKAEDDVIVAKHVFEELHPKQLEISCYHCHQAAEKSLKAFLVSHNDTPEKTHNLVALCQRCCVFDEQFNEIRDLCAKLNPYSNQTRYPNELSISDGDTQIANVWARSIFDFCSQKLT